MSEILNEKRIIEVNGIKMEVDLRHAKVIENYKIGDNVKILIKNYSGYDSYPGVIVAFDEFKNLPTITICYVEINYSKAEVKFASLNSKTEGIEIIHMSEHEVMIDKKQALDYLDNVIFKSQQDLLELQRKRQYFIDKFNQHFENKGQ